ncbi:hypothetical protein NCC49_001940 [Naganishia albida]|nr:hypothetical protein NCC49_001940 [Naganishia albida]
MQVHPSRRALVPQGTPTNAPPPSAREEEQLRARLKERHANDAGRADWKRSSPPPPPSDRYRERGQGGRRASPSYDSYRRPASPPRGFERQDDFMPLGGGVAPPQGRPHGGRYYDDRPPPPPPRQEQPFRGAGISTNDLAARRAQRDASTLSVWPKSPERSYDDSLAREPARDKKRSHKHKHKREKKSSSSSSRKHRRRRDYSSSSEDSSSDSETDDSRERRRRHKRKRDHKRRTPSPDHPGRSERRTPAAAAEDELDDDSAWVVKGEAPAAAAEQRGTMSILGSSAGTTTTAAARADEEEEEEEVGPRLPESIAAGSVIPKHDSKAYANMRPGEGAAMAAFAAEGQRIPRRGEIGLTSEEIEKYEQSGYVMSGSRHRRMNAVRMRKENQIISSEEKRAILKLQKEEKDKREAMIRESFKGLIEDKLAGAGGAGR